MQGEPQYAPSQLEDEGRFLAAVLDTVAALIVVLDSEGRIVRFNRACERLTGYRFEEVQGRVLWGLLLLPEETEAVRSVFGRLRAGDFPNAHENHWVTRSGEQRLIRWSNTALADERGRVRHVIGTGIDVTEQRRAEELARQHEHELARVYRLSTLNVLAAGLAHEISQPLTAIRSYADECVRRLRKGGSNGGKLLGALEQIAAQARRAADTVGDLRGFVSRGGPKRALTDVNERVRHALALIEPAARRKGVAIRRVLAAELPAVSADGVEIEQVVLNLAHNAVEALADSATAQPTVVVRTAPVDGAVEVVVTDNGPGVTAEAADRLFEPFFTTKSKGMGLGLPISRMIVEAHGGRLTAAPNAEGGMSFRFTLPREGRGHGE